VEIFRGVPKPPGPLLIRRARALGRIAPLPLPGDHRRSGAAKPPQALPRVAWGCRCLTANLYLILAAVGVVGGPRGEPEGETPPATRQARSDLMGGGERQAARRRRGERALSEIPRLQWRRCGRSRRVLVSPAGRRGQSALSCGSPPDTAPTWAGSGVETGEITSMSTA